MDQKKINEAWRKWKRDSPKEYDKFQHWTKYHLEKMKKSQDLESFTLNEERPTFPGEVHGNETTLVCSGAGKEYMELPDGNRMKKRLRNDETLKFKIHIKR